ncbi:hypothetical protein [Agrococcus beijingensis]|uniref:hypothetical protein n=1 Tax=Agrococcus beijingensis TaxID=3068634 RepID=UPI0027427644|nr:hypothetical protein [Agrococcus sp. REN33]
MRAGRTGAGPRAHYRELLDLAEDVQARSGASIRLRRETLNLEQSGLPTWLEDVAAGTDVTTATRSLITRGRDAAGHLLQLGRAEEFGEREYLWGAVGLAWSERLEGMAAAHPGDLLALYDAAMLPEHARAFAEALPVLAGGAELDAVPVQWVVSRVPAAFRLLLGGDRDAGARAMCGLVLLEDGTRRYRSGDCGALLRRLLLAKRKEAASAAVREIRAGDVGEGRYDALTGLRDAELPHRRRFTDNDLHHALSIPCLAGFLADA